MSWSQASGRKEIEAQIRAVGSRADADCDLAEAALLLAALDRPRVPLERYRHHLSLLARDTADLGVRHDAARSLKGRLDALNAVICGRYDYSGDSKTYDDLQNANLMRVIDRRRGIPVALAILYIHAARAQGWPIEGINFPGHFLLRLELGGARLIFDPFNGGAALTPSDLRRQHKAIAGAAAELEPQHTAAIGNHDILLRLQNNIKVRLLQDRQGEAALEIIESMLLLAPGRAELWREAGILHAHHENVRAAIMAMENCLELSQDQGLSQEVAVFLQKLKTQLN